MSLKPVKMTDSWREKGTHKNAMTTFTITYLTDAGGCS